MDRWKVSIVLALCISLIGVEARAAGRKSKIDVPIASCGGSTQTSIFVQVCAPAGAGATGLPAGFTIQWMTLADYNAYGWLSSEDPRLCDASFSGNANLSRYNLGPGECVTVDVGEFLFDAGASTSCPGALACGTDYVFRAFGHATSTLSRSDFSAGLVCSTLPCQEEAACTLTQGYWKTHNDTVCLVDPTSPLCVAWPVQSLSLGNVSYSEAQLLSIFSTPAAGNGLIALAHQLIAAKLSIAAGADGTAAAAAIAAADSLIGNLVVPPVGSGFLSNSSTSAPIQTLTAYNEGSIGPGHCQ